MGLYTSDVERLRKVRALLQCVQSRLAVGSRHHTNRGRPLNEIPLQRPWIDHFSRSGNYLVLVQQILQLPGQRWLEGIQVAVQGEEPGLEPKPLHQPHLPLRT